jgi:hypothetical protein
MKVIMIVLGQIAALALVYLLLKGLWKFLRRPPSIRVMNWLPFTWWGTWWCLPNDDDDRRDK